MLGIAGGLCEACVDVLAWVMKGYGGDGYDGSGYGGDGCARGGNG